MFTLFTYVAPLLGDVTGVSPRGVTWTLLLIGLGLGFVIGSPLNYLMLQLTEPRQANSALGTVSLIRSIGTTVAPAIMVGFLAHAGAGMQDRLIAQLPSTVKAPELPYAATLQREFARWKTDDRFADALKGVEFPDLAAKSTIDLDLNGGGQLPADLVELVEKAIDGALAGVEAQWDPRPSLGVVMACNSPPICCNCCKTCSHTSGKVSQASS